MCGPSFCLSALPVGSPSLWFSGRSAVGFCGVDGAVVVSWRPWGLAVLG